MKKFLLAAVLAETLLTGFHPPQLEIKEGSGSVVTKSEKKAVKDLRQLVQTAEVEESWAYAPVPQKWHDIGTKTNLIEGESVTVDNDVEQIRDLAKQYDRLIFYHIHPEKAILKVIKPMLDKPGDSGLTVPEIVHLTQLSAVLPSSNDLANALYISCRYDRQKSHHYKVASLYGIVDYHPKAETVSDFCSEEDNFALLFSARFLGEVIINSASLSSIEESVDKAIKKHQSVALLQNNYFTITFTPYSAFK